MGPADDAAEVLDRLVRQLPGGGEPREGQERMARAVAAAIATGRHLAVQAGTGTGKSLGYLVPAILSGRRIVVATATIGLQDQLGGKDLPFVARHLGRPVEFAVLKGRSNYFCKQKAHEVSGGAEQLDIEAGPTGGVLEEVRLLARWGGSTATGDRSELDFEPRPRAWAQVSTPATECPGAARCPVGEACFAEQARQRAALADVIVVSTALYGMHLASGGYLLPPHDVVVFDEAHELEDVASTSLGLELTSGRFESAARLAKPLLAGASGGAQAAERLDEAAPLLDDHLRTLDGRRIDPAADPHLQARLDLLANRVGDLSSALRPVEAEGEAAARKARAQQALGHLAGDLAYVRDLPSSHVAWVEQGKLLKVAAVDVGSVLAERLWGEVTAVLTSATVPPGVVARLGLPPDTTDVVDVGSPFDHRTQGRLYVPRHLPDPRDPAADERLVDELAWLIGAAGGRTLALFTSHRRMQAAATALDGRLPGKLLLQGQLPKPALVEQFSTDETSSLFATLGFWQGIDVPGRACSVVAIDRIPFPRPDEPLWAARRDRAAAQAFQAVDLPRAATLLAQGAGRLLRSTGDRGVVAVLDPRLATKSYRQVLLSVMPPFKRTVRRDEVEDFLAAALAGA